MTQNRTLLNQSPRSLSKLVHGPPALIPNPPLRHPRHIVAGPGSPRARSKLARKHPMLLENMDRGGVRKPRGASCGHYALHRTSLTEAHVRPLARLCCSCLCLFRRSAPGLMLSFPDPVDSMPTTFSVRK